MERKDVDMSIHNSLAVKAFRGKGHRNVLKRYERVDKLQEKEVWTDESSVFNLPKHRSIKIKKK